MTTISIVENAAQTCLSESIIGTVGAGFCQFNTQATAPSTPSSALRIFDDASDRISWKRTDGFVRTFDSSGLTTDRVYTLPDLTDTILTATSTATCTNKTILGGANGNDITANALKSATGVVTVSASNPPGIGQVLKALTSTTAAWQNAGKNVRYSIMPMDYENYSNNVWINATTPGNYGCIYFPGSSGMNLTTVYFSYHCDATDVTGDIRLYDITNAQTICSFTGLTQQYPDNMISTTALSNIPTSPAIWQVQTRKTTTSTNSFHFTGIGFKYT